MEHEMRKEINKFKEFLNENSEEKLNISDVSGSAFSQEEEDELQRLVIKIKWKQPTWEDMKRADELTRKKWKSQGIG